MALTDSDNSKKADPQSPEPVQDEDDECELTNLNWLTELKNVGYIQLAEGPVDVPLTRFNKFLDELKIGQEKYKRDQLFYQNNGEEKPPFNYAHLIGISLMENGRMTLQQVYDWIQDNFLYYKMCGTNWQSSIRHNLSLGFFFKNTARGDNERGKGGYWELALDSRKTEWKRNRKSRKNRHQQLNESSHRQSLTERSLRKSPLKSMNSLMTKNNRRSTKRFKFSGSNNNGNGKREKKYKDENGEECDSQPTEIILTVEAQTDEYFSITEDTPVEFVQDFNFNNQIFQGSEVPQPIDDVEVPFFIATTTSTMTSNSNSSSHIPENSPNVIVETLPYHFPPLEEYNFSTAFNEQKIFEDLLEYENELM